MIARRVFPFSAIRKYRALTCFVQLDHDLILGHESAGIILEVGGEVTSFKVGDRVSIEPGVACFECKQCVGGRYNLCPRVAFSGTPPTHGTLARYIAHPARFLHKYAPQTCGQRPFGTEALHRPNTALRTEYLIP